MFKCQYCASDLLAGDGLAVTCDICNKVNPAQVAPKLVVDPQSAEIWASVGFAHGVSTEVPPVELRASSPPLRSYKISMTETPDGVALRFRDWRRRDPQRLAFNLACLVFIAYWVIGKSQNAPGLHGSFFTAGLAALILLASSFRPLERLLGPISLVAAPGGLHMKFGFLGLRTRFFGRRELKQLYCERRVIPRNRNEPAETRFHLVALLRDDSRVDLAEFGDANAALFLERELERALDIPDKIVTRAPTLVD